MSGKKVKVNQRLKPVQARSRLRYHAILKAAPQVLLDKGYAKSTTEKIAVEADVSIGTLYRYFSNKEEIFSEVAQDNVGALMAGVKNAAVENASISMEEMVADIVDFSLEKIYKSEAMLKVMVEEFPSLRESVNLEGVFVAIFDAAQTTRKSSNYEISDERFNRKIRIVSSAVLGVIANSILSENPPSKDELKEELLVLIYSYLKGAI